MKKQNSFLFVQRSAILALNSLYDQDQRTIHYVHLSIRTVSESEHKDDKQSRRQGIGRKKW